MTFPRREKAIRRRTRKDPGPVASRAGLLPFVVVALLVVSIAPQASAQTSQGPTSKAAHVDVAGAESSPVHFNLNFLPWRKQSAARQSIESVVAKARPEPVRQHVVRGSSYLPTGGSIPLRFSSARTWPERMTPHAEAALAVALAPDPDLAIRRTELLTQHAAGVPAAPTVAPAEPSASITTTASSAEAAEYHEPQVVNRPLLYGMGEAVLTSDLVLRSLDNISSERGAVPTQFQPAVPREQMTDSVPVATVP